MAKRVRFVFGIQIYILPRRLILANLLQDQTIQSNNLLSTIISSHETCDTCNWYNIS